MKGRSPHQALISLIGNSAFARGQSERGDDAVEIVIPIIFNLDPSSFFAVMKRDVRAEMLLQAILQVFNRRRSNS